MTIRQRGDHWWKTTLTICLSIHQILSWPQHAKIDLQLHLITIHSRLGRCSPQNRRHVWWNAQEARDKGQQKTNLFHSMAAGGDESWRRWYLYRREWWQRQCPCRACHSWRHLHEHQLQASSVPRWALRTSWLASIREDGARPWYLGVGESDTARGW